MATCSAQAILTDGIGFRRLVPYSDSMAVALYQLALIAGTSETAQQIFARAGQFRALQPQDATAVALQQLCIWSP